MKRTIAAAVVFAVAATVFASAQTAPSQPNKAAAAKAAVTAPAFVDANGDGICDNFQTGTRVGAGAGRRGDGTGIAPKDGSGFGRGPGMASGAGSNARGGAAMRRGRR